MAVAGALMHKNTHQYVKNLASIVESNRSEGKRQSRINMQLHLYIGRGQYQGGVIGDDRTLPLMRLEEATMSPE